jgi:hypothetical protein
MAEEGCERRLAKDDGNDDHTCAPVIAGELCDFGMRGQNFSLPARMGPSRFCLEIAVQDRQFDRSAGYPRRTGNRPLTRNNRAHPFVLVISKWREPSEAPSLP